MKKLKELTLKEHADLKRSGLMWVVFPNATGDFREDCEEVKKVKDKCEWKDGKFEGCGDLKKIPLIILVKNYVLFSKIIIHFCPFCGADIRRPESLMIESEEDMKNFFSGKYDDMTIKEFRERNIEPAEPLIVKSGETWVVYWEEVDYLSFEKDIVWATGNTTELFLRQLKKGIWKSFTGPNPDITELTDEIALLRPMVISLQDESNPEILIGVDPDEKSGWHFTTFEDRWDNCRLATAQELMEENK